MRKVYNNKRSIGGSLFLLSAFCFLLFVSCSQEEFLPQETDSDAVKISASIGALQTRVSYDERNTTFDENDQIKVVNKLRTSKNIATYTLTDEDWNTADPFVWNRASKNEFEAWYPLTASYTTFTIPTDQSSKQLLGAADWMTASSGEIDKPENQTLNLDFQHQLSKVTVTIADWNDEFGGTAQEVSTPKIYSKGTDIEVVYATDGPNVTTSDGALTAITPSAVGHTYTAIVAPAKYATTDKLITFTVDGQEMTVLATTPKLTNGLNAGLHYSFNLMVGKDAVTLNGVKVTPWEEKEINGGVATEALSSINATAMTPDKLNATVTKALEEGETDITVTLKPDAPAEMITAIRRAICDTDGVTEGSIHLTLKGVTTIPGTTNWDGVAFGPRNAQWDENNVEIVSHEEVTQLASINLPDVTEIGAQAFYICSNLTSITAPKVQSIGDWGLQGTAITSIDMPLLKEAGFAAFHSTALTEVSLPSLETAGSALFMDCKQLRTVDLPKLQNLKNQLFDRCTSLISVNVPAATSMSNEVFCDCSELVSITLSGVTELLTYGGFAGCTKLENVTLGSVITKVNANLFDGEALSSNITLTLHPDQANAEGDLKATAGTNVEWGGFTWKEVKFSATE